MVVVSLNKNKYSLKSNNDYHNDKEMLNYQTLLRIYILDSLFFLCFEELGNNSYLLDNNYLTYYYIYLYPKIEFGFKINYN